MWCGVFKSPTTINVKSYLSAISQNFSVAAIGALIVVVTINFFILIN